MKKIGLLEFGACLIPFLSNGKLKESVELNTGSLKKQCLGFELPNSGDYEKNDTFHNLFSGEVFVFDGNQWVRK